MVRPLKTLIQPNKDKLSFLADEISTKANAMAITEIEAIIQQKIANTSDDCDKSKTSLDLKKIPAPIDDPITINMAEKKEIFFCGAARDIPPASCFKLLFISSINIPFNV